MTKEEEKKRQPTTPQLPIIQIQQQPPQQQVQQRVATAGTTSAVPQQPPQPVVQQQVAQPMPRRAAGTETTSAVPQPQVVQPVQSSVMADLNNRRQAVQQPQQVAQPQPQMVDGVLKTGYDPKPPVVKQRPIQGYEDIIATLNEQIEATKPRSPEEVEKDERRKRSQAIISSLGEGLSSLINLGNTAKGAKSSFNPAQGLSKKMQEQWEKDKAEREKNAARRLQYNRMKYDIVEDRRKAKAASEKEERELAWKISEADREQKNADRKQKFAEEKEETRKKEFQEREKNADKRLGRRLAVTQSEGEKSRNAAMSRAELSSGGRSSQERLSEADIAELFGLMTDDERKAAGVKEYDSYGDEHQKEATKSSMLDAILRKAGRDPNFKREFDKRVKKNQGSNDLLSPSEEDEIAEEKKRKAELNQGSPEFAS